MAAAIFIFVIGVLIHGASCLSNAERHGVGTETNVGIWGGYAIPIEKAPYMAAVHYFSSGSWKHGCGASIIHEQFVLTAAHCILTNFEYGIVVGTDSLNGNGGELIKIKEINVHPKYSNVTGDYDYCLIELKEPVTFGAKVSKVNLSQSSDDIPVGSMFNVTGWGLTEFGTKPRKLRQVEVPLDDWAKCKAQYQRASSMHNVKYAITTRMICAGSRGRDACQGDSGGPLTVGDAVQIGVTSWGFDCDVMPGVYARVSSVREWIAENLNKHSAQ